MAEDASGHTSRGHGVGSSHIPGVRIFLHDLVPLLNHVSQPCQNYGQTHVCQEEAFVHCLIADSSTSPHRSSIGNFANDHSESHDQSYASESLSYG